MNFNDINIILIVFLIIYLDFSSQIQQQQQQFSIQPIQQEKQQNKLKFIPEINQQQQLYSFDIFNQEEQDKKFKLILEDNHKHSNKLFNTMFIEKKPDSQKNQQQSDQQNLTQNDHVFSQDSSQEQEQQQVPSIIKLSNQSDSEILQFPNGNVYFRHENEKNNQSIMINLQDVSEIQFQDKKLIVQDIDPQLRQNLEHQFIPDEFIPFVWTPVISFNSFPTKRGGHSMNIIGDYLIIFGGCNLDLKCFGDLHFFNIKFKEWLQPKTFGNVPSPRSGHSCVAYGSFLILFGGYTQKGLQNDLFLLDLETRAWQELKFPGPKPSPRSNHKGEVVDGGKILIFGGYTELSYSNEVYIINMVEKRWEKPSLSGEPPLPREGFAMNLVRKNIIYVFGGYALGKPRNDLYMLDLYDMRWSLLQSEGAKPSERQGMQSIKSNKDLIIIGGCNYQDQQCFKEVYALDIDSLVWSRIDSPIEGLSSIKAGSQIYTYGGCYLMENCTSELLAMNISVTCEHSCSSNGFCRNDRCLYEDCSIKLECENECTQRGYCQSNGKCQCYAGFGGRICELYIPCAQNCSSEKNGICQVSGDCQCNNGFIGQACEIQENQDGESSCLNNCSFQGKCNIETGICICKEGFGGVDCSITKELQSLYLSKTNNNQSNNTKLPFINNQSYSNISKINSITKNQNQIISQQSNNYSNNNNYSSRNNNIKQQQNLPNINSKNNNISLLQVKDQTQIKIQNILQKVSKDDIVEKSNCQNECSNNGLCLNFTDQLDGGHEYRCFCNEGFMGEDCSAKKIQDLKRGLHPYYLFVTIIFLGLGYLLGYIIYNKMEIEKKQQNFLDLQEDPYQQLEINEQQKNKKIKQPQNDPKQQQISQSQQQIQQPQLQQQQQQQQSILHDSLNDQSYQTLDKPEEENKENE